MPSNQITNEPVSGIPLWLVALFLIFSLVGFVDATYLTIKHFTGETIPCSILNGCDTVTNSIYATIGPIPISLIGAAYYLVILVASVSYFDSRDKRMMLKMSDFTIIGFVISAILVYLQMFVLDALCLYCLISAGTSTVLFGLGRYMIRYR